MPASLRRAPPVASDGSGDEIEVARIVGVFGVHGEVRLHLHHRESELLSGGLDVILVSPEGDRYQCRMSARRGAGQRVLGRLSAEVSREDVAALIGFRVRVPVAALPPLDEGEYYVWQMIGAAVVVGDAVVGEVTDVHTGGPVEVFEIRLPHTREPAFVPSLAEFVEVVRPGRLQLREGAIQEG